MARSAAQGGQRRWCLQQGHQVDLDADPRQAEELIRALKLDGAKRVGIPEVKPMSVRCEGGLCLPVNQQSPFRDIPSCANYLAAERPEIQFAAGGGVPMDFRAHRAPHGRFNEASEVFGRNIQIGLQISTARVSPAQGALRHRLGRLHKTSKSVCLRHSSSRFVLGYQARLRARKDHPLASRIRWS